MIIINQEYKNGGNDENSIDRPGIKANRGKKREVVLL